MTTLLVYVMSVPLIAESVFAPVNLWKGRTTANWVRFTGLSPRSAQVAFMLFGGLGAAVFAVQLVR